MRGTMHIDDDIRHDPFGDVLAIPRTRAFRVLGIGKTRGHELIKEGVLDVLDLGPRSKPITVNSIRRALRNARTNEPACG